MSENPKKPPRPGLKAAREAEQLRLRAIFDRLVGVAADPDGEHLWLLLDAKRPTTP